MHLPNIVIFTFYSIRHETKLLRKYYGIHCDKDFTFFIPILNVSFSRSFGQTNFVTHLISFSSPVMQMNFHREHRGL